jgi:pre-mRNA cleavage complex 2 protein Pcf11
MKLPAFYLLDAISKNVFEPYARHFAAVVVQLFLDTYEQVDQATRSKMEEMLLTWRTGSPTGKELFGIVPQAAIERGIWGGGTSTHASDVSGLLQTPRLPLRNISRWQSHSGSGQINKSMVITELEFTLGQKERALLANPYDTVSQNHVTVLQQVRSSVTRCDILLMQHFSSCANSWMQACHRKSSVKYLINCAH